MVSETGKSIQKKLVYSSKENVPKVQRYRKVENPICTPQFQTPIHSMKSCLQDALIILIRSRGTKGHISLAQALVFWEFPAFSMTATTWGRVAALPVRAMCANLGHTAARCLRCVVPLISLLQSSCACCHPGNINIRI